MNSLKASLTYFALVFGTGFLFGIIRVPFLVPRLGVRTAELIEMPLMFLAILFAARYVVRRFALLTSARLATGLIALALLLTAEFTVIVVLSHLSLDTYVSGRDPVSGSVYLLMLGVFALMPRLLCNHPSHAHLGIY